MDFKIAKSEFLKGLRFAQSIADRKSTLPMAANVLLRAAGKAQLHVIATDLNVSLTAILQSHNASEGALTVAAKNLFDVVSSTPADEISLRKTEQTWAEIKSGKAAYKMVGMPDRDFPRVPDLTDVQFATIESAAVRDLIDKTMFSVCNDETRYHLNGVLFESTGKLMRMVSTDGHRLSKVERACEGPTLSAGVIIPKKGLAEIRKLLELAPSCQLAIKANHAYLVSDNITLIVKLIEAQFPPYAQVIPKDHKKHVVVDRQRLIDALKRAQLMSSDNRGVRFTVSQGTLTIASDNPDVGEVTEQLDADYAGDAMSIGFNPKYVVDFLSHVATDQIVLNLGGELDPGLLKPLASDDYVGVVMPMKI